MLPRRVVIQSGDTQLTATLRDTETANRLWAALPLSGTAARWGQTVSFQVDIDAPLEAGAHQTVEPGTCCFWCEGQVIALPFGPTPISLGDECKLVAPANAWADCAEGASALSQVQEGDPISVSRHP